MKGMMAVYSNDKIILEHVTENDADSFYGIYSHPQLIESLDEIPFLPNETPKEFTRRIMGLCEFIFTIRLTESPHVIIGDCALHHWNKQDKEIRIGGSLLPGYWGKGYMQAAFELLTGIAKQELGAKTLLGETKTKNIRAIKLVQKMGFETSHTDERETTLRKEIE